MFYQKESTARESWRVTHEEGADKELDEEQIAVVGLTRGWKGAEDRARSTERVGADTECLKACRKAHHLRVVLSDEHEAS